MKLEPTSLRGTVAFTAFLFEAALLLGSFTAIDLLLGRSLRAELQRMADLELQWLEQFVADHEAGGEDFLLEEMQEHLGARTGVVMQIGKQEQLLFASSELEGSRIPATDGAFLSTSTGAHWTAHRPFRGYDLAVGVPASSQLRARRDLRTVMAASGALGLFVAALLARALAAKATAPLAAVGAAAARVHDRNLSERIPRPERAFEEVEKVREAFNQMLDRLEEAVVELRRFTADASHELRTPLSVLKLQAQSALSSGALEREAAVLLSSQLEEIERLKLMVEDLLTLSRLESDGASPRALSAVDFADVVVETVEQFRPVAESRGIALEVSEVASAPVQAERSELRRVVSNLLDNALKYTDPGGRVQVALEADARAARLSVRDTGSGIAESDARRIFERFYRADPSRDRRTGGTGLGLAIVARIAELHGGLVSVASRPGEGSSFAIELPLSPSASHATPVTAS